MEPSAKRQRLYTPTASVFPQSFADQGDDFCDNRNQSDADEPQFEYSDGEEEYEEAAYDPDASLQEKRARLDYKLKTTFEAIFEKYGRDFNGVGDEIDLATGDIVVDNGHLVAMQDERDAGAKRHLDLGHQEETDETNEYFSTTDVEGGSSDQREGDEQALEEHEGVIVSDEDMDEDDMILRGFAQARRFFKPAPASRPSAPLFVPSPLEVPNLYKNTLPSNSEIISQFGPLLGPQIVQYVSQQIPDESHVEPLWRTPGLPQQTNKLTKNRFPKNVTRRSEVEQFGSPETGPSIWAAARNPGRRRLDGKDSDAIFRGETTNADLHKPRGKVQKFTVEEDETLMERVARARKRGLPMEPTFKEMAQKFPRHSWYSYRARYRRNFAYLLSSLNPVASDAATSSDNAPYLSPQNKKSSPVPCELLATSNPHRSSRIRRPAQRDSRIITWSEAVDTIASLDPDMYAGILDEPPQASIESMPSFGCRESISQLVEGTSKGLETPSPVHKSLRPSDYVKPRKSIHRLQATRMPKYSHHVPQSHHHAMPARRASDHQLQNPGVTRNTTYVDPTHTPGCGPCPHIDCKELLSSYKLRPDLDEEVSQMTLHLLDAHQSAPNSCGENIYERKGDRAFLMSSNKFPEVVSSSEILSGSPDLDDTLTSYDRRACINASMSTPLTSVSSSKVNRSGARKCYSREISDSQERSNVDSDGQPWQQKQHVYKHQISPTPSDVGPLSSEGSPSDYVQMFEGHEGHGEAAWSDKDYGIEKGMAKRLSQSWKSNPNIAHYTTGTTSNTLPSNVLKQSDFINKTTSAENECMSRRLSEVDIYISHLVTTTTIPDSQSSVSMPSSSAQIATPLTPSKNNLSVQAFPSSTTVAPETGTDEGHPERILAKISPKTPSMLAPAKKSSLSSAEGFMTPQIKKTSRSEIYKALELEDDLDELSLVPEDFIMLSSRSKSSPKHDCRLATRVKREGSFGRRPQSIAPTKKGKFAYFQGSDDELIVQDSKSHSSDVHVKSKMDLHWSARPKLRHSDTSQNVRRTRTPGFNQSVKRKTKPAGDSTPSSNLTHGRRNSPQAEAEESPPLSNVDSQTPLQIKSSPVSNKIIAKTSQPTSAPNGHGSLAYDSTTRPQVPLVVKTPDGTYRRCGDDGFICGRSFCFRCGSSEASVEH